jgi:hypothetical protein
MHRFRVSERALESVATLRRDLGARVRLFDRGYGYIHAHVRTCVWVSVANRVSFAAPPPGRCALAETVNRRWSLQISRPGPFDSRANALLRQAVLALSNQLPDDLPLPRSRERLIPPAGSGGGSSAPAEVGIPVSWARKSHR